MRRVLAIVIIGLVVPAVPAYAAPPEDPSATGECASQTARERRGQPEDPSFSFPFQCPPPPPFRGEAP
jgi:hypothetical protein